MTAAAGLPRPSTQRVLTRAGDKMVRVDCHYPDTNVVVELLGYRFHRSADTPPRRRAGQRSAARRLCAVPVHLRAARRHRRRRRDRHRHGQAGSPAFTVTTNDVRASYVVTLKVGGRRRPCDHRVVGSRTVIVGAAQLGPVEPEHSRADVVERLIALLRAGADRGCQLVVFPELALTTFFPRWYVADLAECDHYYEPSMPSPATRPLFDEAARLGIGFCLGYAELTEPDATGTRHRYNSQVLVERDGDDRRDLPQGPSARPREGRAGSSVPARRAPLLRTRAG